MGIADSLKRAVEAGDVPGVAATAADANGTIFEGAAGGLKSDSVIWIASMTKAITGAAAMQMVEKGKLSPRYAGGGRRCPRSVRRRCW